MCPSLCKSPVYVKLDVSLERLWRSFVNLYIYVPLSHKPHPWTWLKCWTCYTSQPFCSNILVVHACEYNSLACTLSKTCVDIAPINSCFHQMHGRWALFCLLLLVRWAYCYWMYWCIMYIISKNFSCRLWYMKIFIGSMHACHEYLHGIQGSIETGTDRSSLHVNSE